METKEELVNTIRHLLELDGKIMELKKQQKLLEQERKRVSAELICVMKTHELDKIDTKTGAIKYNVTKSKPLGKRILVKLLEDYYEGDSEKAREVSQFIFDHLQERVTEKIVVKYDHLSEGVVTEED